MRLAVLASGSGSILQAIVQSGLAVSLVVTDRDCPALHLTDAPALLVERTDFSPSFDRTGFTERLISELEPQRIDVVAMAGYMTILSPEMFDAYPARVLNTHPSLLPSFPGAHAVRDALAYGVKVSGCTVHIATATVDAGPILAQECVPVLPGDDEATLHERIKAVERRLYPSAIEEFVR